jgi:hypothetical protein
LLRTRVGLDYTADENITAFVQLQDSRIWGEETSTLDDGSADRLDLHQGYIRVEKFFADPLTLTLGRTEVNFGSQRLVGAVGWHNIGRAFDGAILTINGERFAPSFFYLAQVEKMQTGDLGDIAAYGMNADVVTTDSYKTQVFVIWQRSVPPRILNRATIGFYANGNHGNWGHETEAALQVGKITPRAVYGKSSAFGNDSVKVDVNAFMATFNLWYRFKDAESKPGISAGVDFLSGTKAGGMEGDDMKSFDTLYATNHKFYGFMDFFLNLPVHTYGRGLLDLHGKADATFGSNTAKVAFHVFQSHEDYVLVGGAKSKDFGSELDLTIKHGYSKNLSFTVGASSFWPGDIFKEKKGPDTAWWGYIMTILNV